MEVCRSLGIEFRYQIIERDFIAEGVAALKDVFLGGDRLSFNRAILNPPYRKINATSSEREMLRAAGIETSNLYTAFVWLALLLLEPANSELVAITPRSFCNGPYFKPFRSALLTGMALRRIHTFESRSETFQEDDVLQENVIFHAVRSTKREAVVVSASAGPDIVEMTENEVAYNRIVQSKDPDFVIHIPTSETGMSISYHMQGLHSTLGDLGLEVSTGRVVDFRAKSWLLSQPAPDSLPLIYPLNFSAGSVAWPNLDARKPQALVDCSETVDLLVPAGHYVLVKRFSAKEERRRLVAAVYDPRQVAAGPVGFENHLNYYHARGVGLEPDLAKGLMAFLNSTPIDQYFRQFSGHTQVNASDLRMLRYPSREQLVAIGRQIGMSLPDQDKLDALVLKEMGLMLVNTTTALEAQ